MSNVITDQIVDPNFTGTTHFNGTVAAGDTSITFGTQNTDASGQYTDLGVYVAIVTPADPEVIYNPIYVSVDWTKDGSNSIDASSASLLDGNNAIAKKDTPGVKKTVQESQSALKKALSSKVGEIVNFEVVADLPVFSQVFTDPQFVLRDKVTDGLLVPVKNGGDAAIGNVDVQLLDANDQPITVANFKPTVAIDATTKIVTVTVNKDFLQANKTPGLKVQLKYKGEVTEEAIKNATNIRFDHNDVSLQFTNKPNGDTTLRKDRTNHYTYSLGADAFGKTDPASHDELIKVAVKSDGTPIYSTKHYTDRAGHDYVPLAGAVFTLTGADGTNLTYTTKSDGILRFDGLKGGVDYTLKETKAPAGYVLNSTVYTVRFEEDFDTIDVYEYVKTDNPQDVAEAKQGAASPVTDADGRILTHYQTDVLTGYNVVVNDGKKTTSTYSQGTPSGSKVDAEVRYNSNGLTDDVDPQTSTVQITDPQGTELPSTGGMGTTLFYLIGGALVVVAGVLLATKRRMAKEEA